MSNSLLNSISDAELDLGMFKDNKVKEDMLEWKVGKKTKKEKKKKKKKKKKL